MKSVTESAPFEKLLQDKKTLLVDFYADWCEPCKWAEPILDDVIKRFEGKLSLYKVNIDNFPDIARQYHVMSVPTLILFKNSHEQWRMRGFDTAAKLYAALKLYID